jgi:hypothetical protein
LEAKAHDQIQAFSAGIGISDINLFLCRLYIDDKGNSRTRARGSSHSAASANCLFEYPSIFN